MIKSTIKENLDKRRQITSLTTRVNKMNSTIIKFENENLLAA